MTFRSDTHPNSVTKKQGARGPLAVGGPALHDSAIFARFYAAGNSYLQLLQAQQQTQRTQIELLELQARRISNTVALYQAMGASQLQ